MQHDGRVPNVFYRGMSRTFHRHAECVQLQKRPARGEAKPIVEADLNDVNFKHPCLTCYPDAPRPKVVRRWCEQCNYQRINPCPHNGAVKVTIAYKTNYVGLLREPGAEVLKEAWVWPDRAHFYEGLAG